MRVLYIFNSQKSQSAIQTELRQKDSMKIIDMQYDSNCVHCKLRKKSFELFGNSAYGARLTFNGYFIKKPDKGLAIYGIFGVTPSFYVAIGLIICVLISVYRSILSAFLFLLFDIILYILIALITPMLSPKSSKMIIDFIGDICK